ncbi:MAG TPA: hypothetical protein VGE02_01505 [Gemmatimonadales bacterium]
MDGGAGPSLPLRRELARKALHITSAVVPIGYAAGVPRGVVLALLAALLAVAVVVEAVRHRHGIARAVFHRAAGPLLREHEHHRWSGATWMLVAYALVVWLAPRDAAVAAMWAVAVGDAAAAVVGRWLGRRRFGAAGKSLEGSVACLAATAVGAVWVAGLGIAAGIAAGVAAAAAEWPDGPLDDNVRVAGAVALTVVAATAILG